MRISRRALLAGGLAMGCARKHASTARPEPRWGVQSGEVDAESAVIWSRSSSVSRFKVE
jgi:phosphodiesterase/alkaline phosphatase D-like protein